MFFYCHHTYWDFVQLLTKNIVSQLLRTAWVVLHTTVPDKRSRHLKSLKNKSSYIKTVNLKEVWKKGFVYSKQPGKKRNSLPLQASVMNWMTCLMTYHDLLCVSDSHLTFILTATVLLAIFCFLFVWHFIPPAFIY